MSDLGIGLVVSLLWVKALVGEVLGGEDGLHADAFGALDIGEPVVADVDAVLRFFLKLIQEGLVRARVRFDPADFSGDDDGIEVRRHAQFFDAIPNGAAAGKVGEEGEAVACSQVAEEREDVVCQFDDADEGLVAFLGEFLDLGVGGGGAVDALDELAAALLDVIFAVVIVVGCDDLDVADFLELIGIASAEHFRELSGEPLVLHGDLPGAELDQGVSQVKTDHFGLWHLRHFGFVAAC